MALPIKKIYIDTKYKRRDSVSNSNFKTDLPTTLTFPDNSVFYIELPDQSKQVAMLLLGRTDVVVMDINIFNYLSKEHLGKDHMANVDVHRIFPTNSYHLGFFDENRIFYG